MPWRSNYKDREQDRFIERPSGETAVRVWIANEAGEPVPITFSQLNMTPNIVNKSVPTAATEVSQTITDDTKSLIIRSRDKTAQLQLAFTATESATKYITIRPSTVLTLDQLQLTSKTLYVQSDKGSNTVEILELHT
jgi:hypothetical protein